VRRLWSNKCVGVLREWYIGCVQEVVHRLWSGMWYMVVVKKWYIGCVQGVVHRLCSGSGT
jgi:hypothetical protein